MIDFRDMMLEVIADVRELFRDVMLDANMPQAEAQLKSTWATMDPALKDKLATERPEEYKMLMDQMRGKNGN